MMPLHPPLPLSLVHSCVTFAVAGLQLSLLILGALSRSFFKRLRALAPPPPPPPVSRFSNVLHFLPLSCCPSHPGAVDSQDSPPLDSRCCYYYTCTTHRPSFLPLRSASPAAQVLPSHPHLSLTLSHFHHLCHRLLFLFLCTDI